MGMGTSASHTHIDFSNVWLIEQKLQWSMVHGMARGKEKGLTCASTSSTSIRKRIVWKAGAAESPVSVALAGEGWRGAD